MVEFNLDAETRPEIHVTRISIALCTYQGERCLSAQLESLLAQNRAPDEIVIIDDASTDGTWNLLVDFTEQAKHLDITVRLYCNPINIGYVADFTEAIRKTSGKLIFLCDQDDFWHATKLSRFAAEFERRPDLVMLHSDANRIDRQGVDLSDRLLEAFKISKNELDQIHRGDAFRVLVRRNIATGATMAFRREVINHGFSVPTGWIHDEWLAMLAATRGTVDCLEEAMIDYLQHEAKQVGASRRSFMARLTDSGTFQEAFMTRMLLRTQSLLTQIESGRLFLGDRERRLLSERLRHAQFRTQLPATIARRSVAIIR